MRLADRMSRLGTETAFEVLAKAKKLEAKGKEIIHLEIGEPDFDTPKNIVDAGIRALSEGYTHYGPSAGSPEFREVIAKEMSKTRKINVNPDQVVVTPGAKPIMFFSILALADEGDEIIYPNPGFPIYESVINFIGARAAPIQLREENVFRLDTDELKNLLDQGFYPRPQLREIAVQPLFEQRLEGADMSYFELFSGGLILLSLLFGVLKYFKSKRRREVNIGTFFQILHETKRLSKLIQRSDIRKHKKALEEVVEIIQNHLLKLASETYRLKKSEISKWMLEGKITPDDVKKLLKIVIL